MEQMHKTILELAAEAVTGDRRRDYGSPKENHERISILWNAYISCRDKDLGEPITALDVANMMILLKIARSCNTPTKDTYIDIAGYAQCAAEISGFGEQKGGSNGW